MKSDGTSRKKISPPATRGGLLAKGCKLEGRGKTIIDRQTLEEKSGLQGIKGDGCCNREKGKVTKADERGEGSNT